MKAREKSLLRFVTTGSVDDGKSTLIGRLLYESKAIFEDQYAAVEKTSRRRGQEETDLALLLDGLSAEREQGITIDVAYRYFETPNRKFIIADAPGHIQYTRNTVTGASTADLAVILIDARKGVLTQSRRHGIILSMLQIPHLIVAINKMDLVGFSEEVYRDIVSSYEEFSSKLEIHDIGFIPVSALRGDNITVRSENMPWYDGPTLLHSLEHVHVEADRNLLDFRFPVQYVIRPHLDFRGFAGRIASGTIRAGEEVAVLPSGMISRVKSIATYDGELEEGFAPQCVVITLEDEIDVSRGDMIVRRRNVPQVGDHLDATICWMDEEQASQGARYVLKHTTKHTKANLAHILYRIDVNTLHRDKTEALLLNDIARVQIATSAPVFFDSYKRNKSTGSFILIDPHTSNTVAAGMIRGPVRSLDALEEVPAARAQRNVAPGPARGDLGIPREMREERNAHQAAVLWLTGRSGLGQSEIARALEGELFGTGCSTMLLDDDTIGQGLCRDLSHSSWDRVEYMRRAVEAARLFFECGVIVICSLPSSCARDRAVMRDSIPEGRFFEVHLRRSLEGPRSHSPEADHEEASNGKINEVAGISTPFEEPHTAELWIETDVCTTRDAVASLVRLLKERGIVRGA